jgi:hypothetical protein
MHMCGNLHRRLLKHFTILRLPLPRPLTLSKSHLQDFVDLVFAVAAKQLALLFNEVDLLVYAKVRDRALATLWTLGIGALG